MVFHRRFAARSGFFAASAGAWALAVGFGLAIGAMTPAAAQNATGKDCTVSIQETWLTDLVASADVTGACDGATIDLVVRNGVDEVVWSASYGVGDLFGFDDIADAEEMRVALGDWLDTYTDRSTSAKLPEWKEGADMPEAGEFPFYVAEDLSQPDYEDIRAADYPMLCYVQGRESTLCLIRSPDVSALVSVGAQSFPG